MSKEKIREAIDSLFEGKSSNFSDIITANLNEKRDELLDREYTAISAKRLSESVETVGHAMMVADMTKNLDLDVSDDEEDEDDDDFVLDDFKDDIEDIVAQIRKTIINGK